MVMTRSLFFMLSQHPALFGSLPLLGTDQQEVEQNGDHGERKQRIRQ